MNPGSLFRLADLNERSARAVIARGNAVGERLKGDKSMGSVGQTLKFQEPPRMPAMTLPANPKAGQLISGERYDLGKGRIGTWDGFKFDLEQ